MIQVNPSTGYIVSSKMLISVRFSLKKKTFTCATIFFASILGLSGNTEVQESLFTGFPCLQERLKQKHLGKKHGWWYRTARGLRMSAGWIFVKQRFVEV